MSDRAKWLVDEAERRDAPSPAALTRAVDQMAKAIMSEDGYPREAWYGMTHSRRDDYRLLALDRLRRMAEQ